MNNLQFADRFEAILYKMFKAFDFVVRQGILHTHSGQRFEIDFLLDRNQFETVVEVKFYRTKQSIDDAVRQAAQRLIQLAILQERPVSGLLVISAYAERALKEELAARYGISIWDRNDLYNLIKFGVSDAQLFADFEQLLNEAKQGVDLEY